MKTLLLAVFGATLLTSSAFAGRFGVYVNAGGYGCGPRYYAPRACYAQPVVSYYTPRAVYYQSAPACYYSPATAVYVPSCAPVYRAPIVTGGVTVSTVSFGWRR
jgi:hypothetical protein